MTKQEFQKQMPGSECEEFKGQYSDVIEFWNNCPNSGCMISLLNELGFRNTDALWEYANLIREHIGSLQYNENDERARRDNSASDWGWYYAKSVIENALTEQIIAEQYGRPVIGELFDRSVAGQPVTEAERQEIFERAWRDAEAETRRLQADLLRQVIKDPRPEPRRPQQSPTREKR